MVLVPKKSIAIQARKGPSVTASLADQAPPVVAPVPSVGQTDARAEGAPLAVAEQPAMEVIPLPTLGRTELPLVLVAPFVVGAAPLVEAPPTQAEVATTVTSQAQPDIAVVVPEEAA